MKKIISFFLIFLFIGLVLFYPSLANSLTWWAGLILLLFPIGCVITFLLDILKSGTKWIDRSTKKEFVSIIPLLLVLGIVGLILMGQG